MSGPALAVHQFRYDQKAFWRNPAAVFFTVALPLIFLFIFDDDLRQRHPGAARRAQDHHLLRARRSSPWRSSRRPCRASRSRLTTDRENGILKRGRGTPLPTWVFFAGRVGNALVDLAADAGDRARDRPPPLRGLDPLGAPAGSLGHARGRRRQLLLPRDRAHRGDPERGRGPGRSPTSSLLPLYFLSGVFIPETEIPNGVLDVAAVFPIRHVLRGVLRGLGPGHERRRVRMGPPRRGRGLGGCRPVARGPLLPLDARGAGSESARLRVGSRPMIHHVSVDVSELESRAAGSTTPCSARSAGVGSSTTSRRSAGASSSPVFFASVERSPAGSFGGHFCFCRQRDPGGQGGMAGRQSRRAEPTTGRQARGPSTVPATTRRIYSTRMGTASRSPFRTTD